MYKNLLIILTIILTNCQTFALENFNIPLRGFQNIEKKMNLNVINNLQAIADNDGVEFTKSWPDEYFKESEKPAFIYLAKNDPDSLELIKFDIPKTYIDSKINKDEPTFGIGKIQPTRTSYVYNERLIVNNIPNFINKPIENETAEILLKDGEYFDTKPIKTIKASDEELINTLRECEFDEFDFLKSCKTYNSDTKDLLYSEELILKEPTNSNDTTLENKLLKYIKYNSLGKKIEEFIYANGKHFFYNDNGDTIEFYQYTNNRFKYYNKNLPDLYIDVRFTYNEAGQVVEEAHYDNNSKLIRRYSAEYNNNEISKINVEDILNDATWDIIPIKKQN